MIQAVAKLDDSNGMVFGLTFAECLLNALRWFSCFG